jgi:CheY-like chemotaxis protein
VLQTEKPQLALVDIGLTGMDGYDLAREIRRQIPANQLYLVALTGFGQQADRERALAAGFDIHLTKPFQPQDLARILDAIQRNGPLSDRK